MSNGNGRVVVAHLHSSEVGSHFMESYLAMISHDVAGPRHIGNRIERFSGANVSHGRNEIARTFLETEHEWLLTLDTDIAFPANLIDLLLAATTGPEGERRYVVSGLYFGQSEGELWPLIYQFTDDDSQPSGVQTVRLGEYPKGIIQVVGTGAGCMLIHRSVLEAVKAADFDDAFPWYAETGIVNNRVTGEDITFCLRAQKCGFEVFVDTTITCGHVKPMLLTEELFETLRAAKKMRESLADLDPATLPEPVEAPGV